MNKERLLERVENILFNSGKKAERSTLQVVSADGSCRKFWRLSGAIAVAPDQNDPVGKEEAVSTWRIGRHLFDQGCAVPEIYGFDKESGLLVMEDLGDVSLYQKYHFHQKMTELEIVEMYCQVLDALFHLQFEGRRGFQGQWCYDTPCYSVELMREKESGYFLSAWWQDLLGREVPPGIIEEFAELAHRTALVPTDFFMHRDCQSRNIFFSEGKPKFIDFQGGRYGPWGYDLASLLIDPYVALSPGIQQQLLIYYFRLLTKNGVRITEKEFFFWYNDLALHRNLQIIGAFSFLSHKRKKKFFAQYIDPSVEMLRQRLEAPQFKQFSILRAMTEHNKL